MKIYQIFMVPKPIDLRLSISMQPIDMNWQMSEQPGVAVAFEYPKELKLKLSLETRNCGDVIIVHCQGRIVYRDEAAALSRVVGEVMQPGQKLAVSYTHLDVYKRQVVGRALRGAGRNPGTALRDHEYFVRGRQLARQGVLCGQRLFSVLVVPAPSVRNRNVHVV